jgi:hypothetical protein
MHTATKMENSISIQLAADDFRAMSLLLKLEWLLSKQRAKARDTPSEEYI